MATAKRQPTIVCVDDERIVLESLREQFERQFADEYDIEVAQDAAEALEIVDELVARGVTIPVVISDHIMPGMKGDELLVRLNAVIPDTRKILLTGQAGLDAVGRAVNEAGLYRYISKPWDRDDLALTLREAVKGYLQEMEVRRQREQLAASHAAAQRFVPYPFFDLLGRADLTEVRRGDHAVQEVGVSFSDMRGYTTLVQGRQPAENLAWINEYLECVEAPIRRHGGFIENIEGDAILALFGRGSDALVQAGIESLRALAEHNRAREARGEPPLAIGIGMSTGPVLLGVLGGVDRLQCSVVGDCVNLAARVEGLTKHLGGAQLITGDTYARLEDPSRYELRYVGRVRVQGRGAVTELYEVLDGLAANERARKLATRAGLAAALERYQAGDLSDAATRFQQLARDDAQDRLFAWFGERIAQLQVAGRPAGWDGTTLLHSK